MRFILVALACIACGWGADQTPLVLTGGKAAVLQSGNNLALPSTSAIINPTGVALAPAAANPGGALVASTLWSNSGDANKLYFGAAAVGGAGGTPGGADTQVQFNDSGAFGGNAGLTFDKATGLLTVGGAANLPLGTALAPALYMANVATGIFSTGPDHINFTASGNQTVDFGATTVEMAPQLNVANNVSSNSLILNAVGVNPGGATTLWANNLDGNNLYYGASAVGGTTSPGGSDTQLQFNDTGTFGGDAGLTYNKTTDVVSVVGGILNGNGSASAPTYSFTGDGNTGVYRTGADSIGIATGGGNRLTVDSNFATFAERTVSNVLSSSGNTIAIISSNSSVGGTATLSEVGATNSASTTAELLSFGTASTTTIAGITMAGAGAVGVDTGGNLGPVVMGSLSTAAVGVHLVTNNVDVAQYTGTTWTSAVPIYTPVGSAAAPTHSFSGDTNTGIYNVGADDLGVSAGGALRMDVSTTAITSTIPQVEAAGAVGAPSYTFTGSTTSGLYSSAANTVDVTTNGVNRLGVSTTEITPSLPIHAAGGSAAASTYSFLSNTGLGIYRVGADDLGIATGGTLRFDVSTTAVTSTLIGVWPASTTSAASIRLPHGTAPTSPTNGDVWTTTGGLFARINGATVSYGSSAPAGSDTQVQFNNAGVFGGDAGLVYDNSNDILSVAASTRSGNGTIASPSFAFISDTNTGLYSVGADDLGITTGGTLRWDVSTTAITSTVPERFADGTTGAPAYSFSSDTNTGIYRITADTLGISVGNQEAIRFYQGGIESVYAYLAPDGGAATPSFRFTSDPDNGMFLSAANAVGISAGGTERVTISATGLLTTGTVTVGSTTMITGTNAFTNGAAAQVATLTNGPTAGNPTKWIPIVDNGVTRYIPAW